MNGRRKRQNIILVLLSAFLFNFSFSFILSVYDPPSETQLNLKAQKHISSKKSIRFHSDTDTDEEIDWIRDLDSTESDIRNESSEFRIAKIHRKSILKNLSLGSSFCLSRFLTNLPPPNILI